MSRKLSFSITIALVLALMVAGMALAQTPNVTTTDTTSSTTVIPTRTGCPYGNYVDNDNDGVCDLFGTGQAQGPQYGNHMGGMWQRGGNYVDEDGDGVRDSYPGRANQGSQIRMHGRFAHPMGHGMNGQGMAGGMNRGWNR